jgi:hypothetical protein
MSEYIYVGDTPPNMVWVAEELIADLRALPILLKAGEVSKEKVIEFTEDTVMILEELCGEVQMLRKREAYMEKVKERWEGLEKARRGLHRVEVSDEKV